MGRKKGLFSGSSNPMMKEENFKKAAHNTLDSDFIQVTGERMTVQGAINKSFMLGAIMLVTALYAYNSPSTLFIWGGLIGGIIVAVIASRKLHLSPKLAPLYAVLEGLFVGSITAIYAGAFTGIVFQAISLTMAVFFMMLFIYKTEIIKVTSKLRTGVIMATGAVMLMYIVSIGLSFFGISIPFLHEGGMMGIGISLVIIGIASMNLLLDFDNFEKGEQYGAPTYMEWFSAMGLLMTLVWLYIEILRLLSILSGD